MRLFFTNLNVLFFLLVPCLSMAQLSGTYTIDPSGSGTKNYKSFSAAVSDLNSNGVNGAVTFNVASGTFSEQITLKNISGASGKNTITFNGKDSTKTILKYNTSSANSFVVKFSGAEHFIFQNMTIRADNSTYGFAVHITAGSDSITLRNNIIAAASPAGNAYCIPVTISGTTYNTTGNNGNNIILRNNRILGGYYGVNILGTNTSNLSEDNIISGNTFTRQRYIALYSTYASGARITNNYFDSLYLYYGYNIYSVNCTESDIKSNRIYSGRFGIYLQYENYYHQSKTTTIANNFIGAFTDEDYQSGVYLYFGYKCNIFHNSIHLNNSISNTTYSPVALYYPYYCKVKNNALSATGGGYVLAKWGVGTMNSGDVDYNNYYGNGINLFYWTNKNYSSLSAWRKDQSGDNQNSLFGDPNFKSWKDLHSSGSQLNNRAEKGLGITTDIDGDSRPAAPDTIPDIGADEFYVVPTDLDLISISRPLIPKLGNNNVSVMVKNDGSLKLINDTAYLEYRINSGSWIKDTFYIDSIRIGEELEFSFTQKFALTSSGNFDLCVRINPGMPGDPDNSDSICISMCVGNKGTLVIDSSGNGDYTTFAAALAEINCGIYAPVTFLVKKGTYNEQVVIGDLPGMGSGNPIKFIGEGADKVRLVSAGSSSNIATLLFDGSSYLTFEGMTIENTGSAQGVGVQFKDQSHNISLKNCRIKVNVGSWNGDFAPVSASGSMTSVSGNGNNAYDVEIDSNTLIGGYYGIILSGPGTTTLSDNIKVRNNTIDNYRGYGIYGIYLGRLLVSGNEISTPLYRSGTGIYLNSSSESIIEKNVIYGGRFGILNYYENYYFKNNTSEISNNMISNFQDPLYQSGLYLYYPYNLNIYHNSVVTSNTYSYFAYATCYLAVPYNCNVKNNAFIAKGGGFCFSRYYGTMNIGSVDYNNYYSTGANQFYWSGYVYTSLKSWQTGQSSYNKNSTSGLPNFVSDMDLHVSGLQLNNSGLKSKITEDIDGDTRPISPDKNVDIGADEFYVYPYDVDLVQIDSPIVPFVGNNEVMVTFFNAGMFDLKKDTVFLNYTIDGGAKITDTIIVDSLGAGKKMQYRFKKPWNLTKGGSYDLCVFIDPPLYQDPDSVDKICVSMCTGLRDTFIIDASGKGDYNSFTSAINDLKCGINGPTWFLVKNGTYNEQIELTEVKGAGAGTRIYFIGESVDNVKLNYSGVYASPPVIAMNGGDYFTFKNITINNPANYYSIGIHLMNGADYNEFINCRINVNKNYIYSGTVGILASSLINYYAGYDNNGNYNLFKDCKISGGYFGARINGVGTTSPCYGNSFVNNEFKHQEYYGISYVYQGKGNISGNLIDSIGGSTRVGVYLYAGTETTVEKNRIFTASDAINAYYENYYFTDLTSTISNNMLADFPATMANEGLISTYSYNLRVIYNSIDFTGTSGNALSFTSGSGMDVRNNSIAKKGDPYIFYSSNTAFIGIDNNNYHWDTTTNFVKYNNTNYSDLADWQKGIKNFNVNSRVGEPGYLSSRDLHIDTSYSQLSNWADNTTGIENDFDGEIRNPVKPDVGADEHSKPYDVGIVAITYPPTRCGPGKNEKIRLILKNYGKLTIPKGELIQVEFGISGGGMYNDTFILGQNMVQNDTVSRVMGEGLNLRNPGKYRILASTLLSSDPVETNDSVSMAFRSLENPKASFVFSGYCGADSTYFTSTSSITTASIADYYWDFGDGNFSTSADPAYKYDSLKEYTVSLRVTSNEGCTDSIKNVVKINQTPSVNFSFTGQCLGDSTIFKSQASVNGGIANYEWNFGDNSSSSRSNPSHLFSADGSYTVKLVVTGNNGCRDSVDKVVSIFPSPVATFTGSDICLGDTVNFTNNSTIPAGNTANYSWNFGDGSSSKIKDPSYSYPVAGSFGVRLVVNTSAGCTDTSRMTLRVNEKPVVNFTGANKCYGNAVNFTNLTSISGDSIKTYNWAFGDGNSGTATDPSHLYGTYGTYVVSLVAESYSGCLDTLSRNVTIYSVPNASFTLNDICLGDTARFIDKTTVSNGSVSSYSWDFGDGYTGTGKFPQHEYFASGKYRVLLKATTTNGCFDTISKVINVNVLPVAGFMAAKICLGDTLFPVDTSSVVSGSITGYYWSFGDGTNSVSAAPSHVYSSAGTFTVTQEVTTGKGCKDSYKLPVTIENKLDPSFTLSNSCLGDTIKFSNFSSTLCGNIKSYLWNFGDGNSSTLENPEYVYSAPGTYTVILTLTHNNGTSDTSQKQVTVYPLPVSAFTAQDVCDSVPMKFVNNSTLSTGTIQTYTWNFGDGTKSSAKNPQHLYDTAGAYNVSLITVSDKGCRDTSASVKNVHPLPTADFSVTNVCFGDSLKPVNNSSISGGSLSYSWDFGDGNSSTSGSPSHKYLTQDTFTITLITSSLKGCEDSSSREVVVNSQVIPGFVANNVCIGDSTFFTNTSNVSCGSINSYAWDFGDGNTSTAMNPEHLYAAAGIYDVELIVIHTNSTKDTITKKVSVRPAPSSSFSVVNRCDGDSVEFSDQSTISTGTITKYFWNFGDGFVSNSQNPKHLYDSAGTRQVTLITVSGFGCRDTFNSNAVVYPNPVADFTVPDSICFGDTLKPGNLSSISGGTIANYSWSFGDGGTSSVSNPAYLYTSRGTYSVQLVAGSGNGCKDSATKKIKIFNRIDPDFSASNACEGTAIKFNDLSFTDCGKFTGVTWRFGDGDTSHRQAPVHIYSSPGSYDATLVVAHENGTLDSISKKITIYPKAYTAFSVSNVCDSSSMNFTNQSGVLSGTISSYLWLFGDGYRSNSANPSHTYDTAGLYQVDLITVTGRGCKDTLTSQVEVYPLPVAAFTASDVCLGQAMDFKNNSTSTRGTLSYSWSFGDGYSSSLKEPSYTYSNTGTYRVRLTATTSFGCKSETVKLMNVNTNPVADFVANDTCTGKTVSFINRSKISSGSMSFKWYFGDGDSSSLSYPNHVYSKSDNYQVRLVATSSKGCSESITKTVRINPNPVAGYAVASACFGDTVKFTNQSVVASGSLTHQWNFGDGNTSSVKDPGHVYGNTGSYDVKLISRSSLGCADSITRKVSIFSMPVAGFKSTDVCLGNPTPFTNESTINTGSLTYLWNFGDGYSSSKENPSHIYASAGVYSVSLIAISPRGCRDTISGQVEVFENPKSSFTSQSVCFGDSIRFVNNSVIGTGSLSYKWMFGDGDSSIMEEPVHLYSSPGSYLVSLEAVSINGCADTFYGSVTFFPAPLADFTSKDTCFGNEVIFTNNSMISTGSLSYRWDYGDGNSDSIENPTHVYGSAGKYSVTLTATSPLGCVDSVTKTVETYPLPQVQITYKGDCIGDSVYFTNQSTISSGSLNYSWSFGDLDSSDIAEPVHLYPGQGRYFVEVVATSDQGCRDTGKATVLVYPRPEVSFTVNDACVAGIVNFLNNTTIDSGTLNYIWDFGNNDTSHRVNPVMNFYVADTYLVNLTALSDRGCTGSAMDTFVIFEGPIVDFDLADHCFGDTAYLINKTVSTGGQIKKYTWRFGDGTISNATDPVHVFPADSTFKVTLLAEGARQCVDSTTKIVTVNSIPTAGFVYSTACKNDTVSFTNTSKLNSPSGSMSYSWSFGDGDSSTLIDPDKVFGKDSAFSVTLITTSGKGCRDTITRKVQVNKMPVASFTTKNTCLGDSVYFVNTSSILNDTITGYTWFFGEGGASLDKDPVYSYNDTGEYGVRLIATSGKGCEDTAYGKLRVYPLPETSFLADTTCAKQEMDFTNTSDTLSSVVYWSFGDGDSSLANSPAHIYGKGGDYPVTLKTISQQGCINDFTGNVHVHSLPQPEFTVPDHCFGQVAGFINNSSSTSGNLDFRWDLGDGKIDTVTNPVHVYPAADSFPVMLIAVDRFGCEDTITKPVVVYDYPIPMFTVGDTCEGQPAKFINRTIYKTGSPVYTWKFPNGDTSHAFEPLYGWSIPGSQDVTLVADNKGCMDSVTGKVNIYRSPVDSSFTYYIASYLTARYTPVFNGTGSYLWEFGDGKTSSKRSPLHTFPQKKNYKTTLTITTDSGCVLQSSKWIYFAGNSIAENDGDLHFNIFPNPFHGKTTIAFSVQNAAQVELWVTDVHGRKVETFVNGLLEGGNYTFSFNASENTAAAGIYFVRLKIGNRLVVKRIAELK